jgi:hypothetical protein
MAWHIHLGSLEWATQQHAPPHTAHSLGSQTTSAAGLVTELPCTGPSCFLLPPNSALSHMPAQGYWVWGKLVEALGDVGYDTNTIATLAYDWRLAVTQMEARDRWFTRSKWVAPRSAGPCCALSVHVWGACSKQRPCASSFVHTMCAALHMQGVMHLPSIAAWAMQWLMHPLPTHTCSSACARMCRCGLQADH